MNASSMPRIGSARPCADSSVPTKSAERASFTRTSGIRADMPRFNAPAVTAASRVGSHVQSPHTRSRHPVRPHARCSG